MLQCIPSSAHKQVFDVVRIEMTTKLTRSATSDEEIDDGISIEEEEIGKAGGTIEIGQGVAFAMKSLGTSVLRGKVVREKRKGNGLAASPTAASSR